jgi:hypothetical protein
MTRKTISIAAFGILTVLAASVPDFSGEWKLVSAIGTTSPDELLVHFKQSGPTLNVTAQWQEPPNGRYGLTLLGIVTPKLKLSTDGREDLNQAGPFVLHSRTRWNGTRLLTSWNTSEFLGASFHGEWTRSLSVDGRELTWQIHADSSLGQHSDAVLTFRRQ